MAELLTHGSLRMLLWRKMASTAPECATRTNLNHGLQLTGGGQTSKFSTMIETNTLINVYNWNFHSRSKNFLKNEGICAKTWCTFPLLVTLTFHIMAEQCSLCAELYITRWENSFALDWAFTFQNWVEMKREIDGKPNTKTQSDWKIGEKATN